MEKTKKSTQIYSGKMLHAFCDEVILDDGTESIREYITHPGGVCILGFIDDKVVMEKQFRYPYKTDILELPAGKLEPNENPEDAAKREFEEETGYKVLKLISLGELYPTVAYTNEIIHLYFAEQIIKGNKHLDFDERISISLLKIEDIIEKIRNNEIRDAKTIALIFKYLDFVNTQRS